MWSISGLRRARPWSTLLLLVLAACVDSQGAPPSWTRLVPADARIVLAGDVAGIVASPAYRAVAEAHPEWFVNATRRDKRFGLNRDDIQRAMVALDSPGKPTRRLAVTYTTRDLTLDALPLAKGEGTTRGTIAGLPALLSPRGSSQEAVVLPDKRTLVAGPADWVGEVLGGGERALPPALAALTRDVRLDAHLVMLVSPVKGELRALSNLLETPLYTLAARYGLRVYLPMHMPGPFFPRGTRGIAVHLQLGDPVVRVVATTCATEEDARRLAAPRGPRDRRHDATVRGTTVRIRLRRPHKGWLTRVGGATKK